ncbi:MAG: enolase C-terminal domain-like protein [Candidatus Bathyarchaeia archaeon]
MNIIKSIRSRRVFNSRGEPTIEVEVWTAGGNGRAAAPAGKSKGKFEVAYYPEGGVEASVEAVSTLIDTELRGLDASEQRAIDEALKRIDGTANFSRIGGNAAYALSLACASAAASTHGLALFYHLSRAREDACRLPFPLGNVLGGGKHAGKGCPDIQEFLILPYGARSVAEALKVNFEVHERLGEYLTRKVTSFTGGRGDEGAWAPQMTNEEALEAVAKVLDEVTAELGVKAGLGLDVAASSLWDTVKERYMYAGGRVAWTAGEQIDYMLNCIRKYGLVYVEDPLHEEDFEGFRELTSKASGCLICGDDLFVTNTERLKHGIQRKAASAVIIKPNQVGTLTDTLAAVKLTLEAGWVPVASHRSGETCEPHLAHVAVAYGCPIIKCGVLGGERLAKLNELIRVEEALGENAAMAKLKF